MVVRLSEPRSPSTPRHYLIIQQMAACRLNALHGKTKQKSRFASCDIVPRASSSPHSPNTDCRFTPICILFAPWKFLVFRTSEAAEDVQGVSLLWRTCCGSLIHFGKWLISVWVGKMNRASHHCSRPAKSNGRQTVMQNRQFKQLPSGRLHLSACAASRAQAPIHIYLWPCWHS